jgi:hypothetical protein
VYLKHTQIFIYLFIIIQKMKHENFKLNLLLHTGTFQNPVYQSTDRPTPLRRVIFRKLSQMHPIHTSHPIFLRSILILYSHLCLGLLSGLSKFFDQIFYAFFISPMHATCFTHIILDFLTLIIYGEVYKLCSSSLCSLLQPPTTFSLLGPNRNQVIVFIFGL